MTKIALALIPIMGVVASARAADTQTISSVYVGGSVSQAFYKQQGLATVNPATIGALAGWKANNNFGVELRVGANLTSGTTTLPHANLIGSKLKLIVEHYESLYLTGSLPLTDKFSVVALAGFTNAKLRAHAGTSTYQAWATTTDSSFSGALGGEFQIGKQSSLSLEFGRLLNGDGYNVDAITAAYRYHF